MAKKKGKYDDLFAICSQHGLNYKEIVLGFTGGQTDSLSSLSDENYQRLLLQMKTLNKTKVKDFVKKPGDKARKALIRMAMDMGLGNGNIDAAIIEIDEWCRKQKFKKGFMDHTPAEYGLLVTIFEQRVQSDYFRDLNK